SVSSTTTQFLDAVGAIRRASQQQGPAPHKPLLILLALGRVYNGHPRLAPFSEYETPLRELLNTYNPDARAVSPDLPFWHLQSDGLWEVVDEDGQPLRQSSEPLGDPPLERLRQPGILGGFPEPVFALLRDSETLFAAAQLILEMAFPSEGDEVAVRASLDLPTDDAFDFRELALRRIRHAVGEDPVQEGPGQTYRLSNGSRLYVRTMKRFPRGNGWYSYWFGLNESSWVAPDFFVLQCGLSGTLVVPVDDWLPYQERVPLAKAGTERQPQIWRRFRQFQFRVTDASGRVPDEGRLDARRWLDRFDLLMRPQDGTSSAATSVWWVNQGRSYSKERDGGYV